MVSKCNFSETPTSSPRTTQHLLVQHLLVLSIQKGISNILNIQFLLSTLNDQGKGYLVPTRKGVNVL